MVAAGRGIELGRKDRILLVKRSKDIEQTGVSLQIRISSFPFKASSLLNFYFYTYLENTERIISVLANLLTIGPDQRMQKWGDH